MNYPDPKDYPSLADYDQAFEDYLDWCDSQYDSFKEAQAKDD